MSIWHIATVSDAAVVAGVVEKSSASSVSRPPRQTLFKASTLMERRGWHNDGTSGDLCHDGH